MGTNPGIIYQIPNGKYAIAYKSKQQQELLHNRKVILCVFEDELCTKPVMENGKPL